MAEELRLLIQVGLARDPIEAIQFSTLHSAEAIGVADDLGTLQAGKFADIAVCAGDESTDVTALRDIRHVLLNGKVAIGG